jgi:hypothetical protein
MLNKMATRRDVLKASAVIAGAALVPTALLSSRSMPTADPQARGQIAFIKAVLQKHTRGSQLINRKHVNDFATAFTEKYGVVDYKGHYSGLHGEYKLTRLFARSIFRPRPTLTRLGA